MTDLPETSDGACLACSEPVGDNASCRTSRQLMML